MKLSELKEKRVVYQTRIDNPGTYISEGQIKFYHKAIAAIDQKIESGDYDDFEEKKNPLQTTPTTRQKRQIKKNPQQQPSNSSKKGSNVDSDNSLGFTAHLSLDNELSATNVEFEGNGDEIGVSFTMLKKGTIIHFKWGGGAFRGKSEEHLTPAQTRGRITSKLSALARLKKPINESAEFYRACVYYNGLLKCKGTVTNKDLGIGKSKIKKSVFLKIQETARQINTA